MKWIIMLMATLFICWLDYGLYDVIAMRGGWDAYVATNPFAGSAVMCTLVFNMCYFFGWWIVWLDIQDEREEKTRRNRK